MTTARMSKEDYATMKQGEQKELQGRLDRFMKEAISTKAGMKSLTDHYRISGLYGYSLTNSILIKIQGATIAQSFNKWKELSRCVKAGEKSHISIFAPIIKKDKNDDGTEETKLVGYRMVPIFAYEQTSGEPLAYDHNSTECMDVPYTKVLKVAEELSGVAVVEEITGNARGYTDGTKLVVSSMSNDVDKTKTLIHELGHKLLHTSKAGIKREVSQSAMEVEAESIGYLVMSFLGLEFNLSKAYVANYAAGIGEARTDLIIRCADKVIKALKKELTEEEQFLVALA